jgi:hypothetical protein
VVPRVANSYGLFRASPPLYSAAQETEFVGLMAFKAIGLPNVDVDQGPALVIPSLVEESLTMTVAKAAGVPRFRSHDSNNPCNLNAVFSARFIGQNCLPNFRIDTA